MSCAAPTEIAELPVPLTPREVSSIERFVGVQSKVLSRQLPTRWGLFWTRTFKRLGRLFAKSKPNAPPPPSPGSFIPLLVEPDLELAKHWEPADVQRVFNCANLAHPERYMLHCKPESYVAVWLHESAIGLDGLKAVLHAWALRSVVLGLKVVDGEAVRGTHAWVDAAFPLFVEMIRTQGWNVRHDFISIDADSRIQTAEHHCPVADVKT